MAENPDLQNWQGRQYESFGRLRIDTGNPELGDNGSTVYALIAEGDSGTTSFLGMSEGGDYNILNDECITITGGVKKSGEAACINIIGKNGDVTITAMKSGDVKIKGSNIIIDADENIDILSKKNVKITGKQSIFFDTPNLGTNALYNNLAPRDVTFGGLAFRGTQVGLDKIEAAFTGGAFDSLADQAQDLAKDASKQLKDIAGNIDTGAIESGLQDAFANFGGF